MEEAMTDDERAKRSAKRQAELFLASLTEAEITALRKVLSGRVASELDRVHDDALIAGAKFSAKQTQLTDLVTQAVREGGQQVSDQIAEAAARLPGAGMAPKLNRPIATLAQVTRDVRDEQVHPSLREIVVRFGGSLQRWARWRLRMVT
jgi:hypothetical protein